MCVFFQQGTPFLPTSALSHGRPLPQPWRVPPPPHPWCSPSSPSALSCPCARSSLKSRLGAAGSPPSPLHLLPMEAVPVAVGEPVESTGKGEKQKKHYDSFEYHGNSFELENSCFSRLRTAIRSPMSPSSSVVIIDEAHNLVDSLNKIFKSEITSSQVLEGNPYHIATSEEMAIYRANNLILR